MSNPKTRVTRSNQLRITEDCTEILKARYRLDNFTTMERLESNISAGGGAVLKYGDRVLFTNNSWIGEFIGAVYEFSDSPEETGLGDIECRLQLIHTSEETFEDGGHAIAWALAQT